MEVFFIIAASIGLVLIGRGIRHLEIKSIQKKLGQDSPLLPSLVRWSDKIQQEIDRLHTNQLIYKKRPARKAYQQVSDAKKETRAAKKELETIRNRLDLYESLAPWLRDHVDMTVDEILSGLREEEEYKKESQDDEDPARKYVTAAEWKKLSPSERNQRALDRYLDPKRKKSLWRVGIDYERYVGYLYESDGYQVKFHGALEGKSDLGIDLICTKEGQTIAIQCKRLAAIKQIPVRENVVAQTYGAAEYLRMSGQYGKNIKPMIVTTFILSDQARLFAKHLGVEYRENLDLSDYPMIKCNVSAQGKEKIYHLPIDQQYDKIVIGDNDGEFYAWNVKEAEEKGFRRAYRYRGLAN